MSVTIQYGCGHEITYPCLPVATMRDPLEMNCPACLGMLWPDQVADAWRRGEIKKWKECATEPIFHCADSEEKNLRDKMARRNSSSFPTKGWTHG